MSEQNLFIACMPLYTRDCVALWILLIIYYLISLESIVSYYFHNLVQCFWFSHCIEVFCIPLIVILPLLWSALEDHKFSSDMAKVLITRTDIPDIGKAKLQKEWVLIIVSWGLQKSELRSQKKKWVEVSKKSELRSPKRVSWGLQKEWVEVSEKSELRSPKKVSWRLQKEWVEVSKKIEVRSLKRVSWGLQKEWVEVSKKIVLRSLKRVRWGL